MNRNEQKVLREALGMVVEKGKRIKELENDLGNTERCEQAQIHRANKAEQRVMELEAHLTNIIEATEYIADLCPISDVATVIPEMSIYISPIDLRSIKNVAQKVAASTKKLTKESE